LRRLIVVLFFIALNITIIGCSNNGPKIDKWDNSKYQSFTSSVGIDVFNEHSFNFESQKEMDSYKANNTLYIKDLTEPITVKFNNNGKDRNFIMNVYYDYQPISFKIGAKGDFTHSYKFDLDDGYEIELPLYLPSDLNMTGSHKLFITFTIGYDLHAKDFDQVINWYGASTIQDIIFEPDIQQTNFEGLPRLDEPTGVVDLKYDYTLNLDYDYGILNTGILPTPPVTLTVKPEQEFKLIYNVSYPGSNAGQVLLMATIGYESTYINYKPYLVLELPDNKTAVGELTLTAPPLPGLYEIISYSISSPFDKISGLRLNDFIIQSSPRFTLEVKD